VDSKGPNGETVETLKPAPPALLAVLKRVPGPVRGEIVKALRLKQYTDQKTQKKVIGWPARVDYVWRVDAGHELREQLPERRSRTRAASLPGRPRSATSPA
jgi:hypothetical protein